MHEVSGFGAWESFYVIVGSSAAALTGLQFVVMALVAESNRAGRKETIAAFGSPTIVHFCSALLVSAICTTPWPSLASAGRATGLAGLGGLVYVAIVYRRARRQSDYQPVFEDWLWHTMLPAIAYVALLVSGAVLTGAFGSATFFVGAAALLLVFVGIHSAWDTVVYVAIDQRAAAESPAGPVTNLPAKEPETPKSESVST